MPDKKKAIEIVNETRIERISAITSFSETDVPDYCDLNKSLTDSKDDELHHYLNESFHEKLLEEEAKREKIKVENNSYGRIPQALISCLNELQYGGNVISWKIVGQGENLTVKVTWNNDEKKKSNYTLNSNFLIVNERSSKNSRENITSRDESATENDYEFHIRKYENNSNIKKELNNFRSKLKLIIKDLINGLDEISTLRKSIKCDQDEYDDLIYSSRSNLKLAIQSVKYGIKKELSDLKELRSNRLTLLLIVNEIEKCVKSRSGKMLKEIESLNDFEASLFKLEDQLASLVIRKYLSKRKFASLVDLLTKHVDYDQEHDMQKLKKHTKPNKRKNEIPSIEHDDSSYKSISSSSKSLVSNSKLLNSSKSNENLLLSLNSLINKNDEEKADKDFEILSSTDKTESDWQENWSFIGKDPKAKPLDEIYASIDQFTSNNSPVNPLVPGQKENDFSLIHENDNDNEEDDDDKVSDATLHEKTSPENSFANDLPQDDKDIEKTAENDQSEEEKTEKIIKIEEPQFLINPKKLTKSSSYYRKNDERLESETETESLSNRSLTRFQKDDTNRISPKAEINDPRFELRPHDRLIRFGETVKFICKANGSKPLEVFWYKMNGDELQNNEKYEIYHDDEFHYLKVFNTVESDSGMYLCVISNDKDQNIDSFCLALRDNNREFREPKFLIKMEDIEIEEGYSATFKIKIDFGYPKSRILFYKNGLLILNDYRHEIYYCGDGVYHLHLPNVTDEDNSKYTCVVVNNAGRIESSAELYVVEKENVKRPDMMLKLQSSSFKTLNNSLSIQNKSTHSIDNMDKTLSKNEEEMNFKTQINPLDLTERASDVDLNISKIFLTPNKQEQDDADVTKSDTQQAICSISITSYDLWNEQSNFPKDEQEKEIENDRPDLNEQYKSFKETVNNYLSDDLTQLTLTSHIDKLNSSFQKIVEENEALNQPKKDNILENIDENLKIFKQMNQSPNVSSNNIVQINTNQQTSASSSILNAINLEKRNSLLLYQPPEVPINTVKEIDDTNYEENFTFTTEKIEKNISEFEITQDYKETDFTYISVNPPEEIVEKVETTEIVEEIKEEIPIVVNEPVKSSLPSKDIVQNEYKEFKIEPVKKLKKIWESQILPRLEPNVSKQQKNIFNEIKPAKKWSSMQSINQKEINSSRNSSSSDCSKEDEDPRSNMNNVLNEIKRLDFSRSQQSLEKCEVFEKAKKATSNESLNCSDLETNRIVEKLKHKFDNKDHCFNKIASLTCRNVLNKEQSNSKSSSASRPMLSLYEHNVDDLKEKPKAARLIKSESENNLQSICSSSSSTNHSLNNSFKVQGKNEPKLRKANSLSTYSVNSSVGTRSSSSATCDSINIPLTHRNNIITSQQSFNKEIKSLLDIAENRTKILCKVYDSSLSEQENSSQNHTKEEVAIRRPIIMNKNRFSLQNQLNDHLIKRSNDYKGIINSNYLKSYNKQSNVIQKVKLWDQMVETGKLLTDKWDSEFIEK
ncbi:unnamed protein product [Brachionus calyciflorus]|uniref:Ig-like domain-containing protein n=1 Tax=Brachionus calyciflorus TaxID=104777 RepID=A0A813TIA2_9BILA|nr:unnamed protein product [Brachionus calyciflorus]